MARAMSRAPSWMERGTFRAGVFGLHVGLRAHLNAVLIDKPAKHLGRTVGAVAHQSGGVEIEALHRAFDHAFGGENLRLPDRGGRLDIDDDRIVGIDQIICRVGEEGLPAMSAGPARRRIGR